MEAKDYNDVRIGDIAYDNDCNEEVGEVTHLLDYRSLSISEIEEWSEYLTLEELKEVNFIIVEGDLYAYDWDPSSVICKK